MVLTNQEDENQESIVRQTQGEIKWLKHVLTPYSGKKPAAHCGPRKGTIEIVIT
jgi:hypothetical protein